ncbi:hypothetical protein AYO45_01765 [Gammaproteobacteria bacterium SCGC AG-212-F23]|nr:hypothetical protein AYO45_01765 [Gammaproteobacteria bacterium SCGC AG-212-F23]
MLLVMGNIRVKKLAISIVVIFLMTCASSIYAGTFLTKTYVFEGKKYLYELYIPQESAPTTGWPVILFLHGSGESGYSAKKLKNSGIGRAIQENETLYHSIVIMPQIPDEDNATIQQQGKYGNIYWNKINSQNYALSVLQYITNKYESRIDKSRIYLTGLSMGGSGTWRIAQNHPNIFAAIVPVAACQQLSATYIANLKNIPIWVFHSLKDEACPVENTKILVGAMKKINGNILYTEYKQANHPQTWKKAYSDANLLEWLLKQKRK